MTWSKFGEEFSDAAKDLSDAAFRTHVEAIMWSNRRLQDLMIKTDDVRRFAETPKPDAAITELVDTGWWQEIPTGWYVGCRFAEWQLESTVIEVRRALTAQRQRKHRMHAAGDHSLCGDKCSVTRDETRDPERYGAERNGSVSEKEVQGSHLSEEERTMLDELAGEQGYLPDDKDLTAHLDAPS